MFVGCPALTAPEHGSISPSSRNYGVAVTYSCDPGYNLVGGVKKTCLFGGNWSPGSPRCQGLWKLQDFLVILMKLWHNVSGFLFVNLPLAQWGNFLPLRPVYSSFHRPMLFVHPSFYSTVCIFDWLYAYVDITFDFSKSYWLFLFLYSDLDMRNRNINYLKWNYIMWATIIKCLDYYYNCHYFYHNWNEYGPHYN